MDTEPESLFLMPVMIPIAVVFPAALGPRRACISPCFNSRFNPLSALVEPKDLTILQSWTALISFASVKLAFIPVELTIVVNIYSPIYVKGIKKVGYG